MKKLLVILMAVTLVTVLAGPAAAYFENNSLHFVAYEETDNTSGNDADAGTKEMHYDLGNVLTDWIQPWTSGGDLPTGPWPTAIDLGDYDTDDWTDVYVGVYGRVPDFNNTVLGIDPSSFVINTSSAAGFSAFVSNTAYGDISRTVSKTKLTDGSYTKEGLGGSDAGTYAQLVNANDAFDAEMQLGSSGSGAIDLWYGMNNADASTWKKMGTLTASIQGGAMELEFTQVPVPSAILLLGSGLVGLVGIRRRRT